MRKRKKEVHNALLVHETLDYADATEPLSQNIYTKRLLLYLVLAATRENGPLDIMGLGKRGRSPDRLTIPFPVKEVLGKRLSEDDIRNSALAFRKLSETAISQKNGEKMFELKWESESSRPTLPSHIGIALGIWQLLLNFDNGYVVYDYLIATNLRSAAATFLYKRIATVRTPFVTGIHKLLAVTGADDADELKAALAEAKEELDVVSPVSVDFFENRDPLSNETDGFLFVPKTTGVCPDINFEYGGPGQWITPEMMEHQLFLNPDGLRNHFGRRILACLIEAAKQAVYGTDESRRKYDISRNFLSVQIRFPFSYVTPEYSGEHTKQRNIMRDALASLVHLGFRRCTDNVDSIANFGNAYGDVADEQTALFYISEDIWDIFIDWAREKKEYDTDVALKLGSVEAHYLYNRLCSAKVPFLLDVEGLLRQVGTDLNGDGDTTTKVFSIVENARKELSRFVSVSFHSHLSEFGDSKHNIIICPEHERRRYPRLRITR